MVKSIIFETVFFLNYIYLSMYYSYDYRKHIPMAARPHENVLSFLNKTMIASICCYCFEFMFIS